MMMNLDYIHTRMHIYTFMAFTDGITAYMCLCMLLAANSLVCYWVNVWIDVMLICADII